MQPQITLVPPSALNPDFKKVWWGVDMIHDVFKGVGILSVCKGPGLL